jgi:hypothetical protein
LFNKKRETVCSFVHKKVIDLFVFITRSTSTHLWCARRTSVAAASNKKNDESNDSNKLFYTYMNVEYKHNIVTPP